MPNKITIDGNSWHCRIYHLTWDDSPKDLCTYVRGIFTSLLVILLKVLFLATFVLAIGSLCYAVGEEMGWGRMLVEVAVVTGIVMTGVFLIIGGVVIFQNLNKISDSTKRIASRVTPRLMREWLKAKKEKVCPLVEIDYSKKDDPA